jgi:metal-sulfur cluster biosynthetic enzyme
MTAEEGGGREAEVRVRLAGVSDPELDEPVTDLGFVSRVAVGPAGDVEIGFRLPTYWCAANFAFMMAEDMRAAAAALPWVSAVRVVLDEHMYAETVNRAMSEGLSFREAFGAEAEGDLAAIRFTFAVKAFQRRALAVIEHLFSAGLDAGRLVALDIGRLRSLGLGAEGTRLRARYLEKRAVAGPADSTDYAFVTHEGVALTEATLPAHLRACRRVAVNGEFNGALCRGLLVARYGEDSCVTSGMTDAGADGNGVINGRREPTLRDFVRAASRERQAAARPAAN